MAKNKLITFNQSYLELKLTSDFTKINQVEVENNKKLVREMFLKYPKEFITSISKYYPLTNEFIEIYKEHWNWGHHYNTGLSRNKNLQWSVDLIKRYDKKWYWGEINGSFGLSFEEKLPMSEDLIEKFKENWNWGQLSRNPSISWSEELIEKFKEKWNWYCLSSNKNLPWSFELIDKYYDKWDWKELSKNENIPWASALIEKYNDKWCWWYKFNNYHVGLSYNEKLPWTLELIEKYHEKWNWDGLSCNSGLPWTEELIEKFKNKWNWSKLSNNTYLPWTEEIIDRYIDKWIWDILCWNQSLPWSEKLIEKFKDNWMCDGFHLSNVENLTSTNLLFKSHIIKWEEASVEWGIRWRWGTPFYENYYLKWKELSRNKGLVWSEDILSQYVEKWDWEELSRNPSLPWSENLILKFKNRWDWTYLSCNLGLPWSEEFIEKFEDEWKFGSLVISLKCNSQLSTWIICKYSNELLLTYNFIWDNLKTYIDDELIREILNNEMKIAGTLTINNWNDTKKNLKINNNNYWDDAYEYFEKRIYTRYINPINAIINIKPVQGEGFSILNLQCSLIETIECFINGWLSEFDVEKRKTVWRNKGVIAKYPKANNDKNLGNAEIFLSFFENRSPIAELEIDGTDFFRNVRCGLLHETQTKNNWKIKKGSINGISYEFDGEFKIIYRDNFQNDIVELLMKYKGAIINGNDFDKEISTCELRENFIAKMNHICDKS